MFRLFLYGLVVGLGFLAVAKKGSLFGVAVSCISAGSATVKENFQAGLVLLIVGVALAVLWAVLVERQSYRAGERAALRLLSEKKARMASLTSSAIPQGFTWSGLAGWDLTSWVWEVDEVE